MEYKSGSEVHWLSASFPHVAFADRLTESYAVSVLIQRRRYPYVLSRPERESAVWAVWTPFFVLSVLRLYRAYIHVKESWSFILPVPFNHEADMTARPAAGRSNGNLIRLYVVYTLVDAGIGGYKLPSINFRYKTLF
jgi:hypothetical protein